MLFRSLKLFGEKAEKVVMGATVAFSVIMAVLIFMLLPYFLSGLFRKFIVSNTLLAIVEGCIRMGIFILYVALISSMKDIRRTYMYHGAEHKCIGYDKFPKKSGQEVGKQHKDQHCQDVYKRQARHFLLPPAKPLWTDPHRFREGFHGTFSFPASERSIRDVYKRQAESRSMHRFREAESLRTIPVPKIGRAHV